MVNHWRFTLGCWEHLPDPFPVWRLRNKHQTEQWCLHQVFFFCVRSSTIPIPTMSPVCCEGRVIGVAFSKYRESRVKTHLSISYFPDACFPPAAEQILLLGWCWLWWRHKCTKVTENATQSGVDLANIGQLLVTLPGIAVCTCSPSIHAFNVIQHSQQTTEQVQLALWHRIRKLQDLFQNFQEAHSPIPMSVAKSRTYLSE